MAKPVDSVNAVDSFVCPRKLITIICPLEEGGWEGQW